MVYVVLCATASPGSSAAAARPPAQNPLRHNLIMPVLLPVLLFAAALQPYDLVIRNGHIVDGTGSPWYAADLAIRNGRIAAIGKLDGAPAKRTFDARGLVVAPGFIDML